MRECYPPNRLAGGCFRPLSHVSATDSTEPAREYASAVPDVVVVGGGIIGAACARELARGGASVTLMEKDELVAGASGRNLGLPRHFEGSAPGSDGPGEPAAVSPGGRRGAVPGVPRSRAARHACRHPRRGRARGPRRVGRSGAPDRCLANVPAGAGRLDRDRDLARARDCGRPRRVRRAEGGRASGDPPDPRARATASSSRRATDRRASSSAAGPRTSCARSSATTTLRSTPRRSSRIGSKGGEARWTTPTS